LKIILAMEFKDYYNILGVNFGADSREIRNAYRRLANLHHPDKHPENSPETEPFLNIREAYDVLADPVKRKEYDRKYEENRNPVDKGSLSRSGYHGEFYEQYADGTDAFMDEVFSRFFKRPPGGKTQGPGFGGGSGHIHYDDLLENK
jgi:DnaJ-class molecular chaperone